MMGRNLAALGVVATLTLLATAARADDAKPTPLRSMTFHTDVVITTLRQVHTDRVAANGGNTDDYHAGAHSVGVVHTDVTGLMKDQGIVIDISENTDNRKAPVVRVGVTVDGNLLIDPRSTSNLMDEERSLLGYLGRGFLKGRPTEVGKSWTIESTASNTKASTTYTVQADDGDGRLSLVFDTTAHQSGANPFDLTRHGTLVYDAKTSVPIELHYTDRTRSQTFQQLESTDSSVSFMLESDTYKRP